MLFCVLSLPWNSFFYVILLKICEYEIFQLLLQRDCQLFSENIRDHTGIL